MSDRIERACLQLKSLRKRDWRSETARLGVIIDDVETAIENGMSVKAVYERLVEVENGLTLSLKGFFMARYRLKKRGKRTTTAGQKSKVIDDAAEDGSSGKKNGPDFNNMMAKLDQAGALRDRSKK